MSSGQVMFEIDGVMQSRLWVLPTTGGWETWAVAHNSAQRITLSPGLHRVRLHFPIPNYRLLFFDFVEHNETQAPSGVLPGGFPLWAVIGIVVGGVVLIIATMVIITRLSRRSEYQDISHSLTK